MGVQGSVSELWENPGVWAKGGISFFYFLALVRPIKCALIFKVKVNHLSIRNNMHFVALREKNGGTCGSTSGLVNILIYTLLESVAVVVIIIITSIAFIVIVITFIFITQCVYINI